jgi:hypothetical protein
MEPFSRDEKMSSDIVFPGRVNVGLKLIPIAAFCGGTKSARPKPANKLTGLKGCVLVLKQE